MTVTFAADVTLAALQQQLATHNQWLPIDGDPDAALGELILRNSTGPLRSGFGAWRDVLLGAQFTNGRGELISVGGRVLKNVAGYDVTKLLVGSYGVFGTPVTFTARTWKNPSAALHVVFGAPANAPDFVNQLLPTPLRPHWTIHHRGELHIGYLGDAAAIDFFQTAIATRGPAKSHAISPRDEIELRHRVWPDPPAFRASVPPARLTEFFARTGNLDVSCDVAFGIVVGARHDKFEWQLVRDAAIGLGGSVIFFDDQYRAINVQVQPAAYDILVKLKQAFDPDNTLPPIPLNRT